MILIYQESQEIWKYKKHTVMQRKPRQQVSNSSSDLRCTVEPVHIIQVPLYINHHYYIQYGKDTNTHVHVYT